jgi:hypothetical protein
MIKTTKEVRIYKLDDKYSVECNTEVIDGKEFVHFYLSNGTQKFFCFGANTNKPFNERELAFVCDEYIHDFEEELNVLNDYYNEKFQISME